MKTSKKTMAIAMTTALVMGTQYVNDKAALCALRDMESEFCDPLICMDNDPMPEDIQDLLMQETTICASKSVSK